MSKTSYYIRIASCLIWMGCGIATGGLLGYASAVASLGFYVAMRLDSIGYED